MKTIHGWEAIPSGSDPRLRWFTVPGSKARLLLRRDVGPYLVAFAADYNRTIRPLDGGTPDDWSWSPMRTGRASSSISDHCAGVAIDLNAVHVDGAQSVSGKSWWRSMSKLPKWLALKRRYRLLEHGADYTRVFDGMHHVIARPDVAQVKAEMRRLGIDSEGRRQPA